MSVMLTQHGPDQDVLPLASTSFWIVNALPRLTDTPRPPIRVTINERPCSMISQRVKHAESSTKLDSLALSSSPVL